ncbi:MAG: Protein translocase subunit SecE [Chlamydiae bacterium]|nr:Protein translocase subunit SecE [Chlamydiota bacterium]
MNLMDTKKGQSSASESVGFFRNIARFFGDVKQEIQKITWTNKEELRVYTKIVVGATFVLGLGIYAVDVILRTSLDGLSNIIHWIAG